LLGWRFSSQLTFFSLKRGNKVFNEGDALLRTLRGVHEKSVMAMLLELGGFLAKRTANALAELQFGSCPGRVEIGEAFSAQVFHLCEKFLEVSDTAGKLFNCGGFGAHARRF
jgi:hypothetical protein